MAPKFPEAFHLKPPTKSSQHTETVAPIIDLFCYKKKKKLCKDWLSSNKETKWKLSRKCFMFIGWKSLKI